jgi:hypothetical protein
MPARPTPYFRGLSVTKVMVIGHVATVERRNTTSLTRVGDAPARSSGPIP